MKIKDMKTLETLYIYNDGHAVAIHEKRDKDAGYIRFVDIYENVGIKIRLEGEGRIILHHASMVAMLEKCQEICATQASVSNGSENTKKLGIPVGSIGLNYGYGTTYLNYFPDLINSDITPQVGYNYKEKWEDVKDKGIWCNYPIRKKYTKQ